MLDRSLDAKRTLYAAIVEQLGALGIPGDRVSTILHEIDREKWGRGGGHAASDAVKRGGAIIALGGCMSHHKLDCARGGLASARPSADREALHYHASSTCRGAHKERAYVDESMVDAALESVSESDDDREDERGSHI